MLYDLTFTMPVTVTESHRHVTAAAVSHRSTLADPHAQFRCRFPLLGNTLRVLEKQVSILEYSIGFLVTTDSLFIKYS